VLHKRHWSLKQALGACTLCLACMHSCLKKHFRLCMHTLIQFYRWLQMLALLQDITHAHVSKQHSTQHSLRRYRHAWTPTHVLTHPDGIFCSGRCLIRFRGALTKRFQNRARRLQKHACRWVLAHPAAGQVCAKAPGRSEHAKGMMGNDHLRACVCVCT